MKKHVFTLLYLLCSGQIFAQNAPIKFVSSIPENNAKISVIHKLSLTFDLSAVYSYYPDIPKEQFGIKSSMNTSTSLTSLGRNIRLYKADVTPDRTNHIALCSKAADFVANSNTIEVEFDAPIPLTPGENYKLILYGSSFYATITGDPAGYGAETKLAQKDTPIIINIEGVTAELENATMISRSPENTVPLETLDDVSVKFKYKDGYGMSVAQDAKAYLKEAGKEDIPSTSIAVDATDNTSVIFNFGNTTLYNGHTYSVYIPENSVYPVDPSTQAPLTDKGNKEITLNDYKGASYRYLSLAARTGIVPKNNSEISYLSTVAINFDFGDTGYSISRQSNPKVKLYEGEKAEDKLVATYTCDQGTATAQIWKFDLKPSTTYLFIMEKGEMQISAQIPGSTGFTRVPDMTNKEIVATYTTPAELALIDKITFQSSVPANNAEVEKLEDVTLNIAPYTFEDNPLYPVIANADAKATLLEVTGETEKELQQIPLTISGNQEEGYSAKGTVGRTLYEGKTYKLRVPAGYFRPSEARLPDYTANDEYVLTLKGKASHYGLAGKSGIVANENLPSVGVAAFYFEGEVTPVPEAKASIYKGDSETPEKETPIFTANGTVYADFGDDTHAPYALEAGVTYRLVLPQGSVASQADAEMMNQAVSVTFNGPAVTEYVTVSYVTDNATAKTQVAKGNTASYTFTLEPKWEVKSLLFNDAEVKESITAGVYTTPALNADATLKVTLNYTGSTYTEGPGTGVIAPEGTSLKTYSSDGNVVIEGLTADTDVVTVCSMGGAVLQQFTATNVAATITLPANTYYLVKVNDVMMKILNK